MSEPNLISPLLDGFTMGNPVSERNGIRCCPAIKENTDKKYMVKIISVPASQVQMDALLLAGAYKDPADVMDYFNGLAEEIVQEAELLQRLSKLEGFLSYERWQIAPITRRRLGYEVYLLGSYKRTLDRYIRSNAVTHLEAINLGLDLCTALSVCRRAGYLYVDLKPANIFMSEKKEYRIGDIGFISLSALSYSALPDRYRSAYTPPEFDDPMATVNLTMDTYAVGMILYQLYNDGQLPVPGNLPEEGIPSPIHADYELAEIIMKAIHPDPGQRWADPKKMGRALVAYMQKNSVNDVPITPHIPLEIHPEDAVTEQKQETAQAEAEETAVTETPAEVSQEEPGEESTDAVAAETEDSPSEEEPAVEADETAPGEEESDILQPHEMSDELSRMVEKADDLIAHETPEGVVIPEVHTLPDPFAFAKEDSEDIDDSDIPRDPIMEEVPEKKQETGKNKKVFLSREGQKKAKKFFSALLAIAVLAAIGFGGFWYYQNYYLQAIDGLYIVGDMEQLTVNIQTGIDETLLSVVCTDNYGKRSSRDLVDGKATFTELLPNTMYTIQVEIDGFHKLTGQTSDVFTTDATTQIVSFSAIAGPEDGSAVLNFTADGAEPREWTVTIHTDGEEDRQQSFTGHSATVRGLSVGKVYTFTLGTDENLSVGGKTALEYMASRLILAENITVHSKNGNDMTIRWDAPGDVVVDRWEVRCYHTKGFEEKRTVVDTEVYFSGLDPQFGYTFEITAAGMTQPARISVTAEPIYVSDFRIDDTDPQKLQISWDHSGAAPAGGWLLMHSLAGSETPTVIKCEKSAAVLDFPVPGGKYTFTLQAADGTSVINNVTVFTVPEAAALTAFKFNAENLTASLLKTPDEKNWSCDKLTDEDFTDTFAPGESISVALRCADTFYLPNNKVLIQYVIRDTHGNPIPDLVSTKKMSWKDIWGGGSTKNGELTLPAVPATAGEYVLSIYIDGKALATDIPFTVAK